MLNHKPICFLIDPWDILSYVSPILVDKSKLLVEKFAKSWLVQLATRVKRKVTDFMKNCTLFMNQFETSVKLNVLPLGSYDVLIGMDWLEHHQVVLNCFDKTFTYLNNEGEMVTVKGIPRKKTIIQIYSLRLVVGTKNPLSF